MTCKLLMSACLVGQCCRYDAKMFPSIVEKRLHIMLNLGEVAVICPECAAGLDVPRDPVEIEAGKTAADVLDGKGRALTKDGKDLTAAFVAGAKQFLDLVNRTGAKVVILKSKSPSCGVHQVYDGTHSGKVIAGRGIATELLVRNGVHVFDETELDQALALVEQQG